ncbi:MAG: hypothetical protein IPP91_09235 [Betaproteobacteria bacterium]|nr:hypothetical protein [Betaproteobacteria bacterium]
MEAKAKASATTLQLDAVSTVRMPVLPIVAVLYVQLALVVPVRTRVAAWAAKGATLARRPKAAATARPRRNEFVERKDAIFIWIFLA